MNELHPTEHKAQPMHGHCYRYANTALSNTLRDDHPRSVRAIVCTNMEDCLPAYRQLVPGTSNSIWAQQKPL